MAKTPTGPLKGLNLRLFENVRSNKANIGTRVTE